MNRRLVVAAGTVPVIVFLAVYVSRAGHGFLLDDYAWVLTSRVTSAADLWRLVTADNGFYRPIVALTFTIDTWVFGSHPLGFGLTNVALALGCAAAIYLLARAFSLSAGASLLAGLLWLMNFHVTKMAVLWISGRTALLVTIGAVLTATNLLRGRLGVAMACLALALFAKEEAVLVPFLLTTWLWVVKRETGQAPVGVFSWIVASAGVLALYLVARSFTQAMTPATAPSYYAFTFEPRLVMRNIVEYANRTSMAAAGVVLLAVVTLGWSRPFGDARTRVAVRCGAIWLVGALGFAYVLPVRSDLYAAVPSVGACLIAAAISARLWEQSIQARRQWALVVAMAVTLIVSPVYWVRANRLTAQAEFSEAILEDLAALTSTLPPGSRVVIDEAAAEPGSHAPTMAGAFGAQLNDACELRTGRRLDLALASESAEDHRSSQPVVLRLVVRDGRLRAADSR